MLERAVEVDPGFGAAYADLARLTEPRHLPAVAPKAVTV